MTIYEVEYEVRVQIKVNDDSIVARVLENHDDQGEPQPDIKGGRGWRNVFYDLDERDVADMLAHNVGIREWDLRSLDGWADCSKDAVDVVSVEYERLSVAKDGEFI